MRNESEKNISITAMVRTYCSATGRVRTRQIRRALGLTHEQLDNAMKVLKRQGFLKRVGYGVYEYRDMPVLVFDAPKCDQAWRLMRIKSSFTASEIAMLCDSKTNYIYRVIRRYEKDGYVRPYGRRKRSDSGQWEKVWRLTLKGKRRRDNKPQQHFQPDPLAQKASLVCQAVCSGEARHNQITANKTISLCRDIIAQLKCDKIVKRKQNGGANAKQ